MKNQGAVLVKNKCKEKVLYAKYSSPIGPINIEMCTNGLHLVNFDETINNDNFLQKGPSSSVEILEPTSKITENNSPVINQFKAWLQNFFYGFQNDPDVDICISVFGTKGSRTFRQVAWLTLKNEIKFGQTVSYSELAKLCDKPGANQAMGSAMSNNPICLIVPCHRVIKGKYFLENLCIKFEVS